ncbi:hypothetical protein E3N88_30742 [Mikania micrantha]|uniref:DDE Tnp4 domain-containing protein n=1 Tax=Mikania micrantha TaxID=192012 RepID=A0A5N6MN28_9ASTR|nr:hypothetical protein E3N88_30742 [Mikania micrantha]
MLLMSIYKCLKERFCDGVTCLYAKEFLRKPTYNDVQLLYQAHSERHKFPGMLGSIDCTHWVWKNYPIEWRGQYTRDDYKVPTVMLEAVASQDTWFWHAFFGPPGSNNDLNVLDRSYVFSNILDGSAPKCPFMVNGVEYKLGYYLGDVIYHSWATIVKSLQHSPENDLKRCRFKRAQEAARKDVERAFGILKGKWNILHRPAKQMHPRSLRKIMYVCIILHNMILKWNGSAISPKYIEDPPSDEQSEEDIIYQLRSRTTHENLRADLIEHLEHLSQQYHANNPNN